MGAKLKVNNTARTVNLSLPKARILELRQKIAACIEAHGYDSVRGYATVSRIVASAIDQYHATLCGGKANP